MVFVHEVVFAREGESKNEFDEVANFPLTGTILRFFCLLANKRIHVESYFFVERKLSRDVI